MKRQKLHISLDPAVKCALQGYATASDRSMTAAAEMLLARALDVVVPAPARVQVNCRRCGYSWVPRGAPQPEYCPHCQASTREIVCLVCGFDVIRKRALNHHIAIHNAERRMLQRGVKMDGPVATIAEHKRRLEESGDPLPVENAEVQALCFRWAGASLPSPSAPAVRGHTPLDCPVCRVIVGDPRALKYHIAIHKMRAEIEEHPERLALGPQIVEMENKLAWGGWPAAK